MLFEHGKKEEKILFLTPKKSLWLSTLALFLSPSFFSFLFSLSLPLWAIERERVHTFVYVHLCWHKTCVLSVCLCLCRFHKRNFTWILFADFENVECTLHVRHSRLTPIVQYTQHTLTHAHTRAFVCLWFFFGQTCIQIRSVTPLLLYVDTNICGCFYVFCIILFAAATAIIFPTLFLVLFVLISHTLTDQKDGKYCERKQYNQSIRYVDLNVY